MTAGRRSTHNSRHRLRGVERPAPIGDHWSSQISAFRIDAQSAAATTSCPPWPGTAKAGTSLGVTVLPRSRVCSTPGCPTVFVGDGSRCADHEQGARRRHWAKAQGYNTRGHRLGFRAQVLKRDPICVSCRQAEATVADHHPKSRQDLIDLDLDPNDPRYGRGLCKSCHDRETATNQPAGWNAPR